VLDRDKSFIPEPEASEISIQLDKRADGQWRISTPPQGTFITLSKFTEIYRQVPLYFLDPQKRVLVPDPRYVAAQPTDQVPGRIIDLLLGGPSDGLQDAVTSALAPNTALRTGVVFADDGALQVNLTKPGDTSPGNVKLIVAQIVESLRTATNAKIRIQVEGAPLVTDHPDWQIGDLPAYDTITNPSSDLPGMVVVNSRVRQLDDGKPIRGPAGAGDYPVTSAAQSIDGTELALVGMATSTAAQLRVGEVNSSAALVDLAASSLTRPTWLSTSPGGSGADTGNEVWTVADGSKVIRVIKSANGDWVARTVNASALSPFGAITALRLSRDGVRAALVAGGRLVVASVVRVPGSDTVTIRAPRLLQPYGLSEVVGVDWLGADQLVVVTSAQAVPVVQVMVDGGPVGYNRYNLANLSPPMIAVTAAPGRPVIAVDADGMWTSSDIGSVWHPHAVAIGRGSTAIPFYPG
ncbi:MAG: GerMN domain-containing protein, partial [Kutzneria sp.]|nr:GerMN domain-containing protein [Kutzneria sp.]